MDHESTDKFRSPKGVAHWQTVVDALASSALIFDRDLTILAQNAAHERMTQSRREDVLGKFIFDAFPPAPGSDDMGLEDVIRKSTEKVWTQCKRDLITSEKYALQTGEEGWENHYWQMSHAPLIEDGEVVAVLQLSEDVTDQTLTRNLFEVQRMAARDAARIAYFSYDPDDQTFDRTASVDEMFGFAPEEAGPLADEFFARVSEADLPGVNAEVERVRKAPLGTPARFDYTLIIPDTGEARKVRARGAMVIDPRDRRAKLVGVFIDTTDMDATRRRLEQALQDKENLLLEVNHRVKNSLQLASSILRLEARKSGDPGLQHVLNTANARIGAIAEVHGGIYMGDDVTRVSCASLLANMVDAVSRSVGAGKSAAEISLETEDFVLSTDHAVAFGLLTNELLTNAVKFGGHTAAAPIEVTTRVTGKRATLEITNDVCDEATVSAAGTGIGTSLIDGFVRQLGATLERETAGGRYTARVDLELPGA